MNEHILNYWVDSVVNPLTFNSLTIHSKEKKIIPKSWFFNVELNKYLLSMNFKLIVTWL